MTKSERTGITEKAKQLRDTLRDLHKKYRMLRASGDFCESVTLSNQIFQDLTKNEEIEKDAEKLA